MREVALTRRAGTQVNTVERSPDEVPKAAKVELLRRIDDAARSAGASIVQVSAGYGDSRRRILVANTDGVLAEDEQVRCLVRMSVVANGDAGMQTGFQSAGQTVGFEMFDSVDVEELARDAARMAITKLSARPAPSGSVPVVIKRGSGGVLFHEACGHGLEADLVAKGASVYRGKAGELVASPLVTLVDDGTMSTRVGCDRHRRRGPSQPVQRPHPGRRAHRLHVGLPACPQGGPRPERQRSPAELHAPADGAHDQHLRARTAPRSPTTSCGPPTSGVYVAKLGGGSVNTATGDFVFGMTEAYLIENGEITEPLREGNLIGNGPQVLRDIDLLGNDFAMGNPGTCGKDGQGVPVGDGQPTLRVKTMTIGGTAA